MEKRCKCFPVMLLALLACLSVACTHPHARALMDRAQAEMRDNPAGALRRIDSVTAYKEQLSHSERMCYEVLLAVARYKNFIPATSDSVMLEVTRYYRNHGTPNEKLLAFYAAGAVCIDTDKPSLALGFFHDAVSAADTTQADCGILIRLHFLPSEISTLLNVSSQTVTNTRARLLQKLFDKRGGAKQFDYEVRHGDFCSQ